MDVGFYLGELLMQQGEVSVPGLGYFVQVRMSGYYDENERKFYPPYHQAQFDIQSIDDDALAEYIAVKKNISISSAKYFTEKYITNLKQQSLISEVPIGNLGHFYTEQTQLTFRTADKIIDDTIFYGFEPVSINKIGEPVEERPKVELNYPPKQAPVKPAVTEEVQPEVPQPAEQPAPVYRQEEEMAGVAPEFFEAAEEEEEQKKSPLMLLLVIFIAIVVIALGVFALYRYQPDTFAKIAFWEHKTVDTIKPKPIVVSKPDTIATDSLTADSLKRDSLVKDTIANITPAAKKTEVILSQTEVPASKKQLLATVVPPKKKEVVIPPTVTVPAIITKPAVAKPKVVPADNSKILAAPSAAVGTRRFEVYAVNVATIAEANAGIRQLKKAGLDPRWVTDAGGTTYPISIGHFATKEEAKKFAVSAIESGKVPGGNAYAIEVIPQFIKPKAVSAQVNKPVTAMDKLEASSPLLAPPSTATGTRRFEVYAVSTESIAAANTAIRTLRKGGFDPRWVKDATGPLYHISIGHFATKEEAKDFAAKAIESGKVPGGNAYFIEIIPNK